MEYRYQLGNRTVRVQLKRENDGWRASIDDGVWHSVQIVYCSNNAIELELDGRRTRVCVARNGDRRFAAIGSSAFELTKVERGSARNTQHDAGSGTLDATMPGQVVAVAVTEGETVVRGQTLVLLEAMKMELRVTAPHDGHVVHIRVHVGQVVERGQQLLELEG